MQPDYRGLGLLYVLLVVSLVLTVEDEDKPIFLRLLAFVALLPLAVGLALLAFVTWLGSLSSL